MIDEGGARQIMTPRLDALWAIVSAGVQRWLDVPPEISANWDSTTRANIISNNIAAEAIKSLTGLDGIEITYKYRQVRITIDGKLKVIFKKLDHRLRPSSLPTQRAMRILHQVESLLHDLPEPPTNVIVGYQWNVLETGTAGIFAVCPSGSRNEWAFQIDAPEPDAGRLVQPTPFTPSAVPQTGRTAVPKKRKNVGDVLGIKRSS